MMRTMTDHKLNGLNDALESLSLMSQDKAEPAMSTTSDRLARGVEGTNAK